MGGRLAYLKGANVAAEVDAAEKQIRRFGVSDIEVHIVGEGVVDEPTRVLTATVSR